jgi:septum formation protein
LVIGDQFLALNFLGLDFMIVLASGSPRRRELLRNAGIAFEVQAADIDETVRAGEVPREYAERLATEKALAVFHKWPGEWVLGADTIVVVDDDILGKPRDADDAARMLRMLSGRVHQVITGVCLAGPKQMVDSQWSVASNTTAAFEEMQGLVRAELKTASETTLVTVREISEEEIREYVEGGEPMDKAGAYAIQGMASRWIPRIEGDYSNVVGLPVALVWCMLREANGSLI